jgi:Flp pilus assembly protein TadB
MPVKPWTRLNKSKGSVSFFIGHSTFFHNNRTRTLESEKTALTSNLAQLNAQLEASKKRETDLNATLTKARADYSTLKDAHKKQQQLLLKAEGTVESNKAQLEAMKAELGVSGEREKATLGKLFVCLLLLLFVWLVGWLVVGCLFVVVVVVVVVSPPQLHHKQRYWNVVNWRWIDWRIS